MSNNNLTVVKPFGPTIVKVSMPEVLINNLNNYVDKIILDKEKAKSLDHGFKLAGNVKQEFKLENEFLKSSNLLNFLSGGVQKWIELVEKKKISKFNVLSSWIVRQFENEYNPLHFHTGNISGVCYTMLPKDFGKPPQNKKGVNHNGHIQLAHGANIFNCKALELIKPEIGKFILFPNYMLHTVYPFYGPGERRSFSFNADIAIKK